LGGVLASASRAQVAVVADGRGALPVAAIHPSSVVLASAAPRLAPFALAGGASARDAAAGLGRGLTGYWRFDDGAGKLARDLSGNSNDCVLNRVRNPEVWTAGTLGGALDLGETGGWISCAQTARSGPLGDVTVAAWLKPGQFREYGQAAVSLARAGDGRLEYLLGVRGRAVLMRSEAWNIALEHPLPQGLHHWVHVAFTHAADGTTRLYVDGVEVGEARSAPAAAGEGGPEPRIRLGFSRDPVTNRSRQTFRGGLDELAVYDRVLAGDDIGALASGTQPQP
jgi:hypothetical protein